MNIICDKIRGGCGQSFEVTDDLLAEYKQHVEAGTSSGCPNEDCQRVLYPSQVDALVKAVEAKNSDQSTKVAIEEDRWPGFPLQKPVVPDGRRKNGALPGVSFDFEVQLDPEEPTPAEIEKVRRFFVAGLDDGTDCPCCTRHARRQHRPLGTGPARWLIELVYLSDQGQPIHTGEILKSLKGNHISGSDATSVLPLYGLIEPSVDPEAAINPPPPGSTSHPKGRTSGFWRSTKLGRAFALNKVNVPARIVTCLGVPEAFEGDPVSIRDALGKKFNYDEIMGRGVRT